MQRIICKSLFFARMTLRRSAIRGFQIGINDSKSLKECKSDRSRQELSNESLVLKFGFDTAENESSKLCHTVVRQLDRLS